MHGNSVAGLVNKVILELELQKSSTIGAYFYTIKHMVLSTSVKVKPRLDEIKLIEISLENVEVSFSSIHSSFLALLYNVQILSYEKLTYMYVSTKTMIL